MMSNRPVPGVLLLGIGNLLMGDEGVGVHFARRLEAAQAAGTLPSDVDVLDGGTGGFLLMEAFERYPVVVLVDATLDGRPAGEVHLLRPRFAADFPRALSTHDIGLRDVIESLALLERLPDVYLFTVSIEAVQPLFDGLSAPVEAALDEVEKQVRQLLAAFGVKNNLFPEKYYCNFVVR